MKNLKTIVFLMIFFNVKESICQGIFIAPEIGITTVKSKFNSSTAISRYAKPTIGLSLGKELTKNRLIVIEGKVFQSSTQDNISSKDVKFKYGYKTASLNASLAKKVKKSEIGFGIFTNLFSNVIEIKNANNDMLGVAPIPANFVYDNYKTYGFVGKYNYSIRKFTFSFSQNITFLNSVNNGFVSIKDQINRNSNNTSISISRRFRF